MNKNCCYIQKKSPSEKVSDGDINKNNRNKYLLVFHGTSQNITNLQPLYKEIINNTDFAVFAPEYRAFGKNKPEQISQQTIYEDGTNAIDYLIGTKGIRPENIAVAGHSLGGFAAAKVALQEPDIARLILISTVDSLEHETVNFEHGTRHKMPKHISFLFNHFKFLRKPLATIFKTNNFISDIDVPIDIIHSNNDPLIKPQSSINLSKKCKNLNSLTILNLGGHTFGSEKIKKVTEILNNIKS